MEGCLLTIGIATDDVIDTKIFIDDTAQITIQELCQKCRQLKSEKAIDAVFIDYLQLMGDSDEIQLYTEDAYC